MFDLAVQPALKTTSFNTSPVLSDVISFSKRRTLKTGFGGRSSHDLLVDKNYLISDITRKLIPLYSSYCPNESSTTLL